MTGASRDPDFPEHKTTRDTPHIPDYELIRCVGRGAYGDVWLGRSVTGSLRAVKIVRRETFEVERTFQREVEGIENFEPISRGHPGLVDILHVGWKRAEGFFYYIMELADDRLHGQQIQLTDYEPRTLASARVPGERLPLEQCIDVGISLADALAYLHDRKLIHRDIKPSNVVFIEGEAKLVDIGLVAPAGQRTFVGTEGFVPPEGPGSASADIYSLGMVLYEISTGNDRLEFPELPASGFAARELPKWHRLNAIICKACAPNPGKRYASAREMTEDLRDLRAGRKPQVPIARRLAQCAAVLLLLAVAGLSWAAYEGRLPRIPWPRKAAGAAAATLPAPVDATGENGGGTTGNDGGGVAPVEDGGGVAPSPGQAAAEEAGYGSVLISSSPPGASVLLNGTREIGRTGHSITGVPVGAQTFAVLLEHHDPVTLEGMVTAEQPLVLEARLQLTKGPRAGEPWTNSLGMTFSPPSSTADGSRLSDMPVSADLDRATPAIRRLGTIGEVNLIGGYPAIAVNRETADAICEELTSHEQKEGFIRPDQLYEPAPGPAALGFAASIAERSRFHLRLTTYASLTVITEPAGAEIWLNDELQPSPAPVTLANLKTGAYDIVFKKEGYEDLAVPAFHITAGTHETVTRTLEKSRDLVFGKEWSNSLDMRFIPLDDIMLSQWETRREDYDVFAEATGRGSSHVPGFRQEHDHPVVGVNREDAEEFCNWLTLREQLAGLLPEDIAYRLPTDLEWSRAAGREAERGSTPKERDQKFTGVFPWGFTVPPPEGSGNFADSSPGSLLLREAVLGAADTGQMDGYPDDGHAFTAPVGSFNADARGHNRQFFDLAGNVWEWVADDFDPTRPFREGVLRGGSWNTFEEEKLWTTFRYALPPDILSKGANWENKLTWENGFRCALARRESAP